MAFSDKVWWTRKSRIQAEKRLLTNAIHSEFLMLWYSFCGVAASIYYLKIDKNSELAGISWVVYSVLILAMTGFIAGRTFKQRAGLFKDSYVALQKIYEMEKSGECSTEVVSEEYKRILSLSENHSEIDYNAALCKEYAACHLPINEDTRLKPGFDRQPTWYHWVSWIQWVVVRVTALSCLYVLPLALFVGLHYLP